MGRLEDLAGQKFGKLTVLERADNKGKKTAWHCSCDCGKQTIVTANHLKDGKTVSCGCVMRKSAKEKKEKHGMCNTRLFQIWCGIKKRCYNTNASNYSDYGGRGIEVCNEWKNDFAPFYEWSINNGYCDELTLDRKDVHGNYEPDNCRWVTMKVQQNNRTNNHLITYNGETHTLTEWAERVGLKVGTLWWRLKKGWSIERALSSQR